MVDQSSGDLMGWRRFSVMIFCHATPPSSRIFLRPAGSLIRSHGLKPLYRSGLSVFDGHQNVAFAGSQNLGPHVVTTSLPPGRMRLRSSLTAFAISGTKKIRTCTRWHQNSRPENATRAYRRLRIRCYQAAVELLLSEPTPKLL